MVVTAAVTVVVVVVVHLYVNSLTIRYPIVTD